MASRPAASGAKRSFQMSAALGWPKTESVVRKAIKGEQRKVDNDRLREAVALSNASRGAVGLVISETRIAAIAI
jgi:hypothetical protein